MGSERVPDPCCVAVLLTSQYIWQWKWLNFTDIHNHWQAAPFRILQQHPLIRRYRSDADAFASSPEYPCIRYNATPLLPLQSVMSSILSNHSAATFKVIKSNTETVFFAHYSFPPPTSHIQSAPHQFRPTHSTRWYIEDVNIRKDHHQALAVIYLHSLLFNKAIRGFIGDHCGICGGGKGTWWKGRYSNSVSYHIAASKGRAQIRVYVSIMSWLPRRKWKASVRVLHSSIHWWWWRRDSVKEWN